MAKSLESSYKDPWGRSLGWGRRVVILNNTHPIIPRLVRFVSDDTMVAGRLKVLDRFVVMHKCKAIVSQVPAE
jgi:hypothetical protein